MREIEKAFRSKWGDYVSNLIGEKNQVIIFFHIEDYLINKKTHSATYSELRKKSHNTSIHSYRNFKKYY